MAQNIGVELFDDKRLQSIVKETEVSVQSDDIQSCSLDVLSSMTRLSTERKIHAELLENNIDIHTLEIAVPEIGEVNISGMAVSQKEKNRIAEIVKNVNGVNKVNAKLSVWIYPL